MLVFSVFHFAVGAFRVVRLTSHCLESLPKVGTESTGSAPGGQ